MTVDKCKKMNILLGILLVIPGLTLISCQSKQAGNQAEASTDGNRFFITHRVSPKTKDYALPKRREHHKTKHLQPYKKEYKHSASSQDGAPAGPIPVSFKKVIPKREPISHYGNPSAYEVMGKKYEVMTNTTGYKNRGIASWYGTKFHSGRTSSGEKYDMYALTAAHKTLPLPSYVKVRNLNNGKTAIVKVNDRGPFHADRIIDLSYAAAAKLGMLPVGTAPVEIEALKTTQLSLHYYLQAGAFDSSVLADNLRTQLQRITSSPVYVQPFQKKYLVQVGPFASKDMVNRLKQSLEANHIRGSFSLLM